MAWSGDNLSESLPLQADMWDILGTEEFRVLAPANYEFFSATR